MTGVEACTYGGCEAEPVALIKLEYGRTVRRFWYCAPHAREVLRNDGAVDRVSLLSGPSELA